MGYSARDAKDGTDSDGRSHQIRGRTKLPNRTPSTREYGGLFSAGILLLRMDGYPFYTIGQKRNLHCDRQPSVCTLRIDPRRNRIVAGSPDELFHSHLFVREYYTPNLHRLIGSPRVRVKIRGVGRNPEGFAHIRTIDHLLQVDLENPAWAPAPGQPVVFYDGDLVVGGGILDHSLP